MGISDEDVKRNVLEYGYVCGGDNDMVDGRPIGACRVSFGLHNSMADVYEWIAFLTRFFVEEVSKEPVTNVIDEVVVSQICIYPIKSCAAVYLDSVNIGTTGLEDDRRWMIVDANGKGLTQLAYPKLCLVKPIAPFDCDLSVRIDGVVVCLTKETEGSREVRVCGRIKKVRSSVPIPEGMRVLAEYLGIPSCGIVETQESFANESPILLISSASVKEAERRLGEAIDPACFRANITVDGLSAYQEDSWRHHDLIIGKRVAVKVGEACQRCRMICIDQKSGEKSNEPFSSIARHHRVDGRVAFGVHLSGARSDGRICVGDGVEMIKEDEE